MALELGKTSEMCLLNATDVFIHQYQHWVYELILITLNLLLLNLV